MPRCPLHFVAVAPLLTLRWLCRIAVTRLGCCSVAVGYRSPVALVAVTLVGYVLTGCYGWLHCVVALYGCRLHTHTVALLLLRFTFGLIVALLRYHGCLLPRYTFHVYLLVTFTLHGCYVWLFTFGYGSFIYTFTRLVCYAFVRCVYDVYVYTLPLRCLRVAFVTPLPFRCRFVDSVTRCRTLVVLHCPVVVGWLPLRYVAVTLPFTLPRLRSDLRLLLPDYYMPLLLYVYRTFVTLYIALRVPGLPLPLRLPRVALHFMPV